MHNWLNLTLHRTVKVSVGDQDWLTLLSWAEPSLFHILPCQYNLQTSLQYWHQYRNTFRQYRQCGTPADLKIGTNLIKIYQT